MSISAGNLRNVFFLIGGLLVFLGGMDDSMIVAGLEPLRLIPANIAHIMAMAGAAAVGYAKTGRLFGDASPREQVAQIVQAKLEASQPVETVSK